MDAIQIMQRELPSGTTEIYKAGGYTYLSYGHAARRNPMLSIEAKSMHDEQRVQMKRRMGMQ